LEIADEKEGVISECIDTSWEAISDGIKYTCTDFAPVSDCADPSQVSPSIQIVEFNGITIFDACCACQGGTDAASIQNRLVSWRIIAYGHEARATDPPRPAPTTTTTTLPTAAASATAQTPSPGNQTTTSAPASPGVGPLPLVDTATCPFLDDNCSFPIQFNGVCDAETAFCPDCFDCDKCQAYSYDCASCVQNGCVWCKGDATCLSVALDSQYWGIFDGQKVSSCPTTSDWSNTCEIAPGSVFDDPLYGAMAWSYLLINVEPVWTEGVTGAGVHVRVVGSGVDGSHAEFVSKFDVANSCADSASDDAYVGTASASIIAASSNSECAVGIAPGATLSACKFPEGDDAALAQMFLEKMDVVDVSYTIFWFDTCINSLARERNLQQIACPFSQDNLESPCAVCGDNFGDVATNRECLTAVSSYCSRYYEVDELACIEYMDFFVQCQDQFLPTALHDAWAKTITEGRYVFSQIRAISINSVVLTRRRVLYEETAKGQFTWCLQGEKWFLVFQLALASCAHSPPHFLCFVIRNLYSLRENSNANGSVNR
jgi:hypothetical protein